MSDVPPKKRTESIDYAHEVAVLEHLETLKNYSKIIYPQQNDIKRCATAIRFLLLEPNTGLKKSAKFWEVPLFFDVHDIEPLIWQAERGYVYSYVSSITNIFGSNSGAFAESHPYRDIAPYQYDIKKTILVNLDNFLSQQIIFNEGSFLTREEIIKYICYGTGAIHYEKESIRKLTEEKMNALKSLVKKNSLTITQFDDIDEPVLTFVLPKNPRIIPDFRYAPKEINLVFFEFHATINRINDSEAVNLLFNLIQEKLKELEN